MEPQNVVTLAAAGLAFIASAISVAVSAYNARLERFARQRWWERKVQAYADIIEALADLVYYHEAYYDMEIGGQNKTEEHKAAISEHFRRGYANVRRATAVGSFLISPEASEILRKLRQQEANTDSFDLAELVESQYIATRDCLKEMVEIAKVDLNRP